MSEISSNNKRVAKNTLLLYFRMLITMTVNFYISRVVLKVLGVEDYGIYNVVGGVVTMLSFLNACMTTSTQRYLTFELGRGDFVRLKRLFAASLNVHIAICLCIILSANTIGLWFLNTYLNIPDNRMFAANVVFQFSIFTFCADVVRSPFNAAIIAHERMNVFAYISIAEAFMKLGVACIISIATFDKLELYALLVFIVHLSICLLYQLYCHRKYAECRFRLFWDKKMYAELTGFAGWNMFGSIAWLMKDQGVNILLNLFFGPLVNAARGLAMQVSNAVMGFVSNFQTALSPQITKNYSQGYIEQMEGLAYKGSRYSFFLLFFIAFPLMLNIDVVLDLWLEEVPQYASGFIILIMIESLGNILWGNTMIVSMMATGKIRNYQIAVSSILLLIVPVSYIALKCGSNVYGVFCISICITLLAGMARFSFCHKQIGYSVKRMCREIVFPILKVLILAVPLPVFVKLTNFSGNGMVGFVILSLLTVLVTGCSIGLLGLSKAERDIVINQIKKRIQK